MLGAAALFIRFAIHYMPRTCPSMLCWFNDHGKSLLDSSSTGLATLPKFSILPLTGHGAMLGAAALFIRFAIHYMPRTCPSMLCWFNDHGKSLLDSSSTGLAALPKIAILPLTGHWAMVSVARLCIRDSIDNERWTKSTICSLHDYLWELAHLSTSA
jgi:uncharacterized membrane protein YfbV (UPF0208 family)